jgi:hypothetical protein
MRTTIFVAVGRGPALPHVPSGAASATRTKSGASPPTSPSCRSCCGIRSHDRHTLEAQPNQRESARQARSDRCRVSPPALARSPIRAPRTRRARGILMSDRDGRDRLRGRASAPAAVRAGHGEAFGDFHVAAAQAGAQIGAAHYFWLPPKRLTAGNLLTDNRGLHYRRGS